MSIKKKNKKSELDKLEQYLKKKKLLICTKGEAMKKVWIVWFDGYLDRWGSYNYLLGVYDTEELANQAKALLIDQYSELLNRVYIRRVMLNKTLKAQTPFLTDVAHEIEIETDICLGGYCE